MNNEIFITIMSGVGVFVISQFIMEFSLKPTSRYKEVITKIINRLKYYENLAVNPPLGDSPLPEEYLQAKGVFRDLSCELEANYLSIFPRFVFIKLGLVKKGVEINSITTDLIWLANITGHKDETGAVNVPLMVADRIDSLRKKLK